MNKRSRYNLTKEEGFNIYKQTFKSNRDIYNDIRIRSVLFNKDGKLKNALTFIMPFSKDNLPEKQNSLDYGDIKLVEEWKTTDEYLQFLDNYKKNILLINNETVEIIRDSRINSFKLLQSNNVYSQYPGYLYETDRISESNIFPRDQVLVDFKLPMYADIYSAIANWCDITDYHGDNDARNGCILFFLPLKQVYFKNITREDDKVHIKIFRSSVQKVILKGVWIKKTDSIPFELDVLNEEISIDFEYKAEKVHLYLISENNDILDFYAESISWNHEDRKILTGYSGESSNENYILSNISKGECETVEYKPFIKLDDPKFNEIVETVIAMANTEGGIIFIGVTDYGEPRNINNVLYKYMKTEGNTISNKMKLYKNRLQKKIISQISNSPVIDVKDSKINDTTIIIIDINQSTDVCSRTSNNEVFVRRGSSNMRPSPDEIVELKNNLY